VYWVKDTGKELFTEIEYLDTNNNGLIDRIEWVVPHLSAQVYEIVQIGEEELIGEILVPFILRQLVNQAVTAFSPVVVLAPNPVLGQLEGERRLGQGRAA